MLSDTAGFRCSNVRFSNGVKKARLAMIYVTHNCNNRRAQLEIIFVVFEQLQAFLSLFLLHVSYVDAYPEIIGENPTQIGRASCRERV